MGVNRNETFVIIQRRVTNVRYKRCKLDVYTKNVTPRATDFISNSALTAQTIYYFVYCICQKIPPSKLCAS